MKSYYRTRHKILKVLYAFQDEFKIGTPSIDRMLHFDEIKREFPSLPQDVLLDHLQFLVDEKEIHCTMKYENSEFLILANGRNAFLENKYLAKGGKEFRDKIFDIVKIISTILLLLIAIWTFVNNILETKSNEKQIKEMQQILEKNNLRK